jgi:DNA-binding transcriptional MerR regulator
MTEFRIDELARAAGTTVRNVRVYQERGLLPPPRRQGRVGIFSDAHLARLRLIGQLLERGFTFAHIAELVAAWEQGRDLGAVLGLEGALADPWSDELPGYVTAEELVERFGAEVTPQTVAKAVEVGALVPDGDRFRVPSPRLLHAGAEMVDVGIPLGAVLELAGKIRDDLDAVGRTLLDTVAAHLVPRSLPDDEQLAALATAIRRLRPLAKLAVEAYLAQAMERHTRQLAGEQLATLAADATERRESG